MYWHRQGLQTFSPSLIILMQNIIIKRPLKIHQYRRMIVVYKPESLPRLAGQIQGPAVLIAFRLLSLVQLSGPDCVETLCDPAPPSLWIAT